MTKSIFIFLTFFSINIAFTQSTDWQTITNMNDIRDIAIYNDNVWAVSEGGAFIYDPSDSSKKKITNIDGLKSVDLQAVETDNKGNIIFGSSEGFLQTYHSENNIWTDIRFDGSDIKDILTIDDTMWVAAGSGVAVFLWRNEQWEYNDFFLNFPELIQVVNKLSIYNNRIWLATNTGLLSAPSDFAANTLTDPQNWLLQTTVDNLPNSNILSLTTYNNMLWIGTSSGLAYLSNGIIQNNGTFGPNPIVGLSSNQQDLIVLRTKTYFEFNLNDGIVDRIDFSDDINTVEIEDNGRAWIGLKEKGLRNSADKKSVVIDGPVNNSARFVIKDASDRIWVSDGKFRLTRNKGYSILENGKWRNIRYNGSGWYNVGNTNYIYEDRFNNIWLATWGGGVEVYHNNNIQYFHNYSNPGTRILTTVDTTITESLNAVNDQYKNFFVGVPEDDSYEVTTFFKEDFNGNLWIVNSQAVNENYLTVAPYKDGFIDLNKSNWTYFGASDGIDASLGIISIEFDDFGRVWIGTDRKNLFVLDYNNTLNNRSDDTIYQLGLDDNLYSATIKTIAKDNDGIIWIGTEAGLNSFDGSNVFKHIGDELRPDNEINMDGPLNTTINQILVDKFNNKWFATAGGISILRSGKSPFEQGAWLGYNTKNSGLVNDNVNSIFVDTKNSRAIVGTEKGMSIFTGSFAEIQEKFDEVVAGPNPFILKENSIFTIKKLKDNSKVKIFNLSGNLVRKLTAKNNLVDGSRAEWDGKDSNGNQVASGIYLYLAYTENGNAHSGKIAVIRK